MTDKFVNMLIHNHRNSLKAMVRAEDEKYVSLEKIYREELGREPLDYKYRLCLMEPLDHFGLKKTYEMFLQHLSVITSTNPDYSYVDEKGDAKFYAMQHYDFLLYDLQAKAIRYHIHDYMVKRIYKSLFNSGNPSTLDRLVQELVLRKDGHPNWVLTSRETKLLHNQGKKVEDFTDTPEWCNETDYDPSIYKLMKLNETETPHGKALIIEQAVTDAMLTLKMTAPYKPSYKRGEPER